MTTILTRSVLEEIISSFDLKKKIIINFLKDKLNDNCVDIIISYLNSIEKFRYPLLLKLDSELYEPLVLLTNTLNNNPCSNILINFSLYSKYDFNSDKLADFYMVVKELLYKYYKCKNSLMFFDTSKGWNAHYSITNKEKKYFDKYDVIFKNKNNRISFKLVYCE
jgi:hypothetical protein